MTSYAPPELVWLAEWTHANDIPPRVAIGHRAALAEYNAAWHAAAGHTGKAASARREAERLRRLDALPD